MRITDKSLVEQQHISNTELKERLHLFNLTSDDLNDIRAIKSVVGRQLDTIVDEFYRRQTQTPDVESLIGDMGTLNRLMSALRHYIMDLFSKDIDLNYVEHRLRIGLVHKRIGVDPKLYISAVNYLKKTLINTIHEHIDNPEHAKHLADILDRLMDFDVSYVFDTYIKSMMNEIKIEKKKSDQYAEDLETVVQERTKSLEKLTRLDPLTSIYNKRAFEELAEKTFLESRQHNEPITLAYIDVDKFKLINDKEGHEAGDKVLILIADSLRGVSRKNDLYFRLGGDEFAVVLPGTTERDVLENYIPKLMENIHSYRSDISLSYGAAQSGPDNYISFGHALSLADKEMYKHKNSTDKKFGKVFDLVADSD